MGHEGGEQKKSHIIMVCMGAAFLVLKTKDGRRQKRQGQSSQCRSQVTKVKCGDDTLRVPGVPVTVTGVKVVVVGIKVVGIKVVGNVFQGCHVGCREVSSGPHRRHSGCQAVPRGDTGIYQSHWMFSRLQEAQRYI